MVLSDTKTGRERASGNAERHRVLSCLLLAAQCDGREVTTIEGLLRVR